MSEAAPSSPPRGEARSRVAWALSLPALLLPLAALSACGGEPTLLGQPFAADIRSFSPGPGAGFGQSELPQIVLGPPRGGGARAGSTDVLSLGVGGELVLSLGVVAVDGPGPDVIVFENAFAFGALATFAEPATVAFSEDGVDFVDFPCALDPASGYPGCAGIRPVFANADTNTLDPLDPAVAGGDAFDLAEIGMSRARFVRLRDSGLALGPAGDGSAGFDLDAISVVHAEP
ncbi:MAG: cell surface protein [Myxococcales bacterium]|nr:cell surface protein [Myxococcales bacterium]